MTVNFRLADTTDAETIAKMVLTLTKEISKQSQTQLFDINLNDTIERCKNLLNDGHYSAILCYRDSQPIGVATFTETYALYAGGKMGVIQEFYIASPERSAGAGSKLLNQVRHYGKSNNWACIELCTPPLPEFDRTLLFYEKNGLIAVGGRKMREFI